MIQSTVFCFRINFNRTETLFKLYSTYHISKSKWFSEKKSSLLWELKRSTGRDKQLPVAVSRIQCPTINFEGRDYSVCRTRSSQLTKFSQLSYLNIGNQKNGLETQEVLVEHMLTLTIDSYCLFGQNYCSPFVKLSILQLNDLIDFSLASKTTFTKLWIGLKTAQKNNTETSLLSWWYDHIF